MSTTMEWNLNALYQGPEDPQLEADLEKLQQGVDQFIETYRPKMDVLSDSPEDMLAALSDFEKLSSLAHDLSLYATLTWNVETQNSVYALLKEKITRQLTEIFNPLTFFQQVITKLAPEKQKSLLQSTGIQKYQAFIQNLGLFQPHLLSEEEEQLLSVQQQFSRLRWQDFYTRSTNQWTFRVPKEDGFEDLTEDQAMDLTRTDDPERRKAGYMSVYTHYGKNQDHIAYVYNSLIQEYAAEAKLRGFKSTLERQAFEQHLTAAQVTHLLAEVRSQNKHFQQYYQVVKKALGQDTLYSWDKTVPLGTPMKISFEEAQGIILEAMKQLDPELSQRTAEFFKNDWIHAKIMPGKTSGAFCAPSATANPYILVNWNDNMYSLTALAHELGHGLHFYETTQEQHVLHLMPSLFMAETASTLNEYLLADYLMKTQSDRDLKTQFLSDLLQRFMNGIYRQSLISDFEVMAHEQGQNQSLTPEQLGQIWFDLSEKQAGEALSIAEEEKFGWSRIPHIFMYPFYCFNYTLSNLIVLELIYQYQHQKDDFLPRYRAFLRAGGSQSPRDLLAILNIDLDGESFYQQAFSSLKSLVNELETLQST